MSSLKPSRQELVNASSENWKAVFKKADDILLHELALNFYRSTFADITGLRANIEIKRRENFDQRINLWIDRGITIILAVLTTLITIRFS